MVLSYLDDKNFVDFVLEKGNIPFVVRGSLSCLANFNFAPFVGEEFQDRLIIFECLVKTKRVRRFHKNKCAGIG